ncbi:MAG: patatin-like phospholipase family protein [Solidesulfovibrio sp.]|uniref:patatin-like phospholipase family protein n=1 Tax=Solidesulfovibrio sp. TaxID=2910990 RepID=UPI0031591B42
MRILSIDGGGIRGLLPALVLAEFETRTGRSVAKFFDLIAGTSTGGILALGLAAGIPAMRLAEFYLERGPAIFSRSLGKRVTSLGGLADELYDAGELEVALADVFGDRLLSSVETRALAVAFDIEARERVLFRSWAGEDYRLADVGRATSAAPVYFEPFPIRSQSGQVRPCIDGGMVANNPSLLAFTEAEGPHYLVSMGTGRRDRPILYADARDFGAAQWTSHLIDIVFSGQAEEAHLACRAWLGGNYVRLQADLPEEVAMDATDARAFAVLKQAAKRLADSPEAVRALELAGAA